MAGSLVLVNSLTASSSASITLTGVDSTYDVYQVVISNVVGSTDLTDVHLRLTVSGSADDSANYSRACVQIKADSSFSDQSENNVTKDILGDTGTGTGEKLNAVLYLFNFSNASEYSFYTYETSYLTATPDLRGRQGGSVLKETQATDGLHFYMSSGNIASGEFKLYGLKK